MLSPTIKSLTHRYVEAGLTISELCDLFNAKPTVIRSRLRQWGLKATRQRRTSPEQSTRNQKICDLYTGGRTLEDVGQIFGITRERVRQILVANEITERRQWAPPKPEPIPPLTEAQIVLRSRARFWTKVNITTNPDECWEWMYPFTSDYPRYNLIKGRNNYHSGDAHRIAWILTHGYPKQWVLHKCNNPACVNPNHLYEGTPADNVRDRELAGNGPSVNPKAKRRLTAAQVLTVKEMLAMGIKQREIATHFNIGVSTINRIHTGKAWNNTIRGPRKALDAQQIAYVRTSPKTLGQLAQELKVSSSLLSRVRNYQAGYKN